MWMLCCIMIHYVHQLVINSIVPAVWCWAGCVRLVLRAKNDLKKRWDGTRMVEFTRKIHEAEGSCSVSVHQSNPWHLTHCYYKNLDCNVFNKAQMSWLYILRLQHVRDRVDLFILFNAASAVACVGFISGALIYYLFIYQCKKKPNYLTLVQEC